jgi:hypothetical protein
MCYRLQTCRALQLQHMLTMSIGHCSKHGCFELRKVLGEGGLHTHCWAGALASPWTARRKGTRTSGLNSCS